MTRMLKKLVWSWLPLCLLLLSACAGQFSSSPTRLPATKNPDPCVPENLPTTILGINQLMREFDDASQQAAKTPAQGLTDVISNMQRIRRAAEDLQIPPCLTTLKTHQLNHMNLTIQTLIAFVGGADQGTLKSGLEQARQEHDLYSLEVVRLLGITLAPLTTTPGAP
jgi:hypothetical protein